MKYVNSGSERLGTYNGEKIGKIVMYAERGARSNAFPLAQSRL